MTKDVKEIAEKNAKLYKKTKSKITIADDMPDQEDLEYIEMPKWWQNATNTKGLPFRKIVVIAGDPDSGKTSCCITAVKSAQEQGVKTLYIESEGKTSKKDFTNWGVDTKKLQILQESVVENIYDEVCAWIDANCESKMLVVFDSVGNVISQHDAERLMADSGQKPGGKGKSNREGLNKLISKRTQADVALLLISYTYDNIGSHGKTIAGGKAINFFNSLAYTTVRKAWYEVTVKGEKVTKGIIARWQRNKNHINKSDPGPKFVEFKITSDGFEYLGGHDD